MIGPCFLHLVTSQLFGTDARLAAVKADKMMSRMRKTIGIFLLCNFFSLGRLVIYGGVFV